MVGDCGSFARGNQRACTERRDGAGNGVDVEQAEAVPRIVDVFVPALDALAPVGSLLLAFRDNHREMTVPAATLAPYVGSYEMKPGVELTVTLDGNQLKAQLTGQPAHPIFAETQTLFFYKVVDATLEFQRDPAGTVTGVRLRQGRVDSVMIRK